MRFLYVRARCCRRYPQPGFGTLTPGDLIDADSVYYRAVTRANRLGASLFSGKPVPRFPIATLALQYFFRGGFCILPAAAKDFKDVTVLVLCCACAIDR